MAASSYGARRSFTLVELMLAMGFLSILMLMIALATIQIMHTYNRGLSLKAINQSGRELGDSITRDTQSSAVQSVPVVQPTDAGAGNVGRLCLGGVSYLWNTASALRGDSGAPAPVNYTDTGLPIVLARVADAGGTYCQPIAANLYKSVNIQHSSSTEMLSSISNDLALYSLAFDRVPPLSNSTQHALYHIQFTIGTNELKTVNTSNQTCKPPTDINANFDFCSINSFDLLVRVG